MLSSNNALQLPIRISLILLSYGPIKPAYADITTGLVGWWKFDEGTGATTIDSSGSGNTGTLTNSPTWTSGKTKNALSFDGSNYVTMGNVLNLTAQITVSVWVNASSWAGNWPMIVAKDVNVAYLLMQNDDVGGSKMGFRIGAAGAPNTANGSTDLNINQWYHVAGTYDGTTIKIYVNGILDGSQARAGSIPTSANALQIGGYGGLVFTGKIDDVRIYNRALSAQEIYTLYLNDNKIRSGTLKSYRAQQ